jgi:hypothetical protein
MVGIDLVGTRVGLVGARVLPALSSLAASYSIVVAAHHHRRMHMHATTTRQHSTHRHHRTHCQHRTHRVVASSFSSGAATTA